jgi:uncharacterized protein DUF5666
VKTTKTLMIRTSLSILLWLGVVAFVHPILAQSAPAESATSRAVGTITGINGNTVIVKSDSGVETKITVDDSTRIVKAAPGQKDLKDATALHLQDLQVGDRALARGKAGENNSLVAASMIVMKQSDVATRQQQEMQEWQRRGAGGIVRSVEPASGTITVATGPKQSVTVQTSGNTQFLRYPPDSVKFSDAKKSSINEIKAGDQLRARGTRSEDGQQLTADAVISGSFRNIAGAVNSVDASASSVTVMDLITKRPAIVKITPETQMRKIPPEMAQRIAFFLKRSPAASGDQSSGPGAGSGQGMRTGGQGGAPDFQQVIRRMPSATLNDLQKGSAVMIVTTNGAPGQEVTALTLLSGVEPILTAAPTQTSANLLSGWSMGGGGEGENQ